MSDLGVCAVLAGTERRARHEIERAGFGTRNPSYRVSFMRQGKRHVVLRSLFPGYVFPALDAGWGEITTIEGMHMLIRAGEPLRIIRGDAERLDRLEFHCVLGDFNKVQHRSANGQYETRRRKRKPRRSRRLYRNTGSI